MRQRKSKRIVSLERLTQKDESFSNGKCEVIRDNRERQKRVALRTKYLRKSNGAKIFV